MSEKPCPLKDIQAQCEQYTNLTEPLRVQQLDALMTYISGKVDEAEEQWVEEVREGVATKQHMELMAAINKIGKHYS